MIRVTAKNEGFRRCGVAFSKAATEFPDDRFTSAELKILKAETMLTVEEIADGSGGGSQRPNVKDSVVLVAAAETLEALDALSVGEERKGVLDAIAKRRSELTAK